MGINDFLFDAPLARIEVTGLFWFSSNDRADSETEYLRIPFYEKRQIYWIYLAAVGESRIVVRVNDSVDNK